MTQFALWLSRTWPSVFLQEHNAWAIPTIQSVHIVGIAMVMGSVVMIDLRILGWAGTDQTLGQTVRRFGPWLTGSLWLLLATGILMIVGEPIREFINAVFWVALGTAIAVLFLRGLRRHEQHWERTLTHLPSVRTLAVLTFLIWACVIVLGRLIGYDHVWGDWSPAQRQ